MRRPLQVLRGNLRLDTVDAHSREQLAMTLLTAISFSAFKLENNNFLAFSLIHDLTVHRDPVYLGLADLDILAIGKYKDLVEGDR
jgi:hypothetical protein